MPIKIDGVDRVLRALKKMEYSDATNIVEGLRRAADMILKLSQKYVPRETAALAKSGRVVYNAGKGMGARFTVEYGGSEAPYAMIVHERVWVAHAPPTSAKYLERAVRELKGTITNMIKRKFEAKGTRG